jgi:acetyl esterase/lipase
VLAIHGGGWDSGDRTQLPEINHRLARRGYAVAALDYRLAPRWRWPAQRDDIGAALAYLKAHAGELGIDRARFVLFGRSAGGQIATACAYTAEDASIRGVASFYGPQDLRFAWAYARPDDVLNSFLLLKQYLGGPPETEGPVYDSASAYFHVGARTPPTLLMHGDLDTLVWHRQSERLNARLAEAGVPHLFVSLPWATHAFDYNLDGPGGQLATEALDGFLAAVTR